MSYSEGPDKGHAWVIAIAACVITMILSGISKMVGILYVAVINTYRVSRQQATLPFTFRKSLRCLAGPIVGIVGQRYGIRAVTLAGAVVAALGAALCFVAPTVTWLAVCWGGIHGLGESFANTLFQVVVNQYFEKYRSTASGIALSGACVGSVCFSFLIEALRDAYGLQGTFLILSGVILHVIPAAILLKSPSWIREEKKATPKSFKGSIREKPRMYMVPDDYVKSNSEKKMSTISLKPNMLEKNEILCITNLPFKSHSTMNLVENLEKKLEEKKGFDNVFYAQEKRSSQDKPSLEKRLSIQNVFVTSKESLYDRIPSIYDLQKESSLKKNFSWTEEKKNNNERESSLQKTVNENIGKKNNNEKESGNNKSMLENAKSMLLLYKNPVFVLICVCMATYVLVFIPIMTSIVDYSKDKGLPESIGKYLIHAMAIGDIIGRLCFGWVTDKNFISIPRYMTMTLVLEGIFIILLPFTYSLYGFLALIALYAMTAGSMLVRLPVMVLKHVKKEQHSIAMGCYGFASGLVPLSVPLLIGYFRDHIGSYDGMYYLMGSLSIISGGFWLLEPYLARLNERLEGRRGNNIKV